MVPMVVVVGLACMSFRNKSIFTVMDWHSVFMLSKSRKVSIETSYNGLRAGNSRSLRCIIDTGIFLAKDWQSSTVLFTSFYMYGQ